MLNCANPREIIADKSDVWVDKYGKKQGLIYTVPCGKCMNCKINRMLNWTNRLLDEMSYWKKITIVVLTYNDKTIPKTGKNISVYYKDVQDYIKRLRQDIFRREKRKAEGLLNRQLDKEEQKELRKKHTIKTYTACEYGGESGRPHYHIVLFGLGREDQREIDRNWPWGNVLWDEENRPINRQAMQYVAGYVQKKMYSEKSENYYTERGQLEPQNYMSRGIGKKAAIDHKREWCDNQLRYLNTDYSIPRYYIKLYRKENAFQIDNILEDIKEEKREKFELDLWEKHSIVTNPHRPEMWDKETRRQEEIHEKMVAWFGPAGLPGGKLTLWSIPHRTEKSFYDSHGYTKEAMKWVKEKNRKQEAIYQRRAKNYRMDKKL